MSFLKTLQHLFGGRSKQPTAPGPTTGSPQKHSQNPSESTAPPHELAGVYNTVNQHKAKMAQLDREEDEYWEQKRAQLQTKCDTQSSPDPPQPAVIERAEDLAKMAELHFANDRFDEAYQNFDRASLLTIADEKLSKLYRVKANEVKERLGR